MLNPEPNNKDFNAQNLNKKRKKKTRRLRLWEMTSDPKSFFMLLFLGLFFITTTCICLSDVVRQTNERKMEISRLWRDNEINGGKRDNNINDTQGRKKKQYKDEKKKKIRIFSTSLRQAIKKERSL